MLQKPIEKHRKFDLESGYIYLNTNAQEPVLNALGASPQNVPFQKIQGGKLQSGNLFKANIPIRDFQGDWEFRIDLGNGQFLPGKKTSYKTTLKKIWVQDGQLFDYQPGHKISPSKVIKISDFKGVLPTRPIYIYLPRGYSDHTEKSYPVIYMHDGQNCFEAFSKDSYSGSWKADLTADSLIEQGRMKECIIVGVSNGKKARLAEYLPPYITFLTNIKLSKTPINTIETRTLSPIIGQADRTLTYYQDNVKSYLKKNFRVKSGREHTATCGSSLGGVFSMYIAWEHPDFARHHAVISPSFWISRNQEGGLEIIERLSLGSKRDIRLWLDSGTGNKNQLGYDGMYDTLTARDVLLEKGFTPGKDFQYYLDIDAGHNETAWANRLPKIFQFLFPV